MDEERIEALGDLLLVGEGEGALEGDPEDSFSYVPGTVETFLRYLSFVCFCLEKEKR